MRKLLPFLILIFIVLGCTEEARREIREDYENDIKEMEKDALERKTAKFRDEYAVKMSKKFDIHPDCLFRFSTGGTNSKTLYVTNCSSKKGIIKPDDFLEAKDKSQLKSLGFESIEITSWESAMKAYETVWKVNEDSSLYYAGYK